ncbi:PepSY domain-containing protein [Acuticoccus sediminis]|nr:PepSY domain-containing protein [Acuticoccus sediminis]
MLLILATMHLVKIIFAATLLAQAGALVLWDAAPAAAQAGCLSQSAQRQAVRSGQAVRPGQIGRKLGGKVLRLNLCEGSGGLTWRVTVLQGDGRVVDREVDARSGQPIR